MRRPIYKFILPFLLLCSNAMYAQYQGHVFLDLDKNKKMDDHEKGMSEIVVSDGYEVLPTAADGSFSLKRNEKAKFIFVRIPAGYKASGTHYIKIDPKLDRYDFGLLQDEKQAADKLRFIQITDTETPLYGEWIDNIRKFSQQQQAALIMHTGDICYEPGMQFHARQVNSELMGVPTYYTVGNHDLVKGEYGEKLFEDLFGPVYYSFEAGPAHFVVTPMPSGDYAPSYNQDQVIAWLKKDLALKAKDKPLIFINHDLIVGKDFVMKGKTDSIDLKAYNLKGYLYGHWHNNYSFGSREGVAVISTNAPNKGGIDNSVAQFMVIDVDKNGIRNITPKYPYLADHMALIYPQNKQMQIENGQNLEISASVYHTEKRVLSVYATRINQEGAVLEKTKLNNASDWNWRGTITGAAHMDQKQAIMLEVNYGDGTQALKKFGWDRESAPAALLQLTWSKNMGASVWKSSPLVQGQRVYVASMDDAIGGKSKIQALTKQSGETVWTFQTQNSVKQKLAYSKGLILATDMGGTVYAINEKDGKLVWKRELSGGRLPGYVSAGVVNDGIYYTGAGNYLSAIKADDGTIIWQNQDWNGGEGMPGELLVTNGYLITGANWNSLFVHDCKTGKLLWKKNDAGLRFRTGGAVADATSFYVAGLNNLFQLDQKTGAVINRTESQDDFKIMASPLLTEELLIMPTATNGIKAFDRNSLSEKWNFQTGEALIYTSAYSTPDLHKKVGTVESGIRYAAGKLFFGGLDGYLYVLNLDGSLAQKINLGTPILAEVTIQGNEVYVADFAGNIYCFAMAKK
ncbi:PQQ-binding-like beta-propeller repeat protein [Sphingobacterium sp. HMA12]|uniref:outer membrane protein assembly factor BamB family protein n=1 Tax=Sphingobacterium sp. HMA12 TaxID=2050894 RepID=UPI001F335BAC|nr:PQQ-binding-like beta-propeller repeat protein [Sphingobacterium sp. HMA12]